uniref:Uncharacterized protein n=1 Tax=Ciona intestinalis TaxID=7719 RepID=H2XU19_CIOIN
MDTSEDKNSQIFRRQTNNSPVMDQAPPPYEEVVAITSTPAKSADSNVPMAKVSPQNEVSKNENMGGGDASPESTINEAGVTDLGQKEAEPEFPMVELDQLEEMINRTQWVVPVLPNGQLEVLLQCAIKQSTQGAITVPCKRFLNSSLVVSFTKILTDDAVSNWKLNIHECIYKNILLLIELCISKLSDDFPPLLELLGMAINPHCKYHIYNAQRASKSVPFDAQLKDDELYARPADTRQPRGWLVDLVNYFGKLDGFEMLQKRFQSGTALNVPVIVALIRPFGEVSELLTAHICQTYFLSVIEVVINRLDSLTDDEIKKEANKQEQQRGDSFSIILKSLKRILLRISLNEVEEKVRAIELFRLKMILR